MGFDLTFLGAASTVTGSKYLLTCKDTRVLVDCGLFQGIKSLRLQNWDKLPVKPSEIKAIILTHAHIDHSGYIPRFIKDGFRGKIYCTKATYDLCRILLPDSGYLMQEEAEFLNRTNRSKHKPALPLFTEKEAKQALDFFESIDFHAEIQIDAHMSFQLNYAGHILGAASAIVNVAGKKIAFSGDIGRLDDELLYAPESLPQVNYLVVESTYGNRLHKKTKTEDEMERIINSTYQRGGVLLIPAFAVGRAQSLMYYLWKLRRDHRIPEMPMYLNSPMATNANDLLQKYKDLHKLSAETCSAICNIVKYVNSPEESQKLNERHGPMLIISASGMLSGGRVLHHLKQFGPDKKNTILLAGYQAAGTRGDAIEHGAREVKVHGHYVEINAQVEVLDNVSAHADYGEIISWLKKSKIHPEKVFITHGEPAAADELRRRLHETFGWHCEVPNLGHRANLE